jgi:hypothetical protein
VDHVRANRRAVEREVRRWRHACSFVNKGMAHPRLRCGRTAKVSKSPGRSWMVQEVVVEEANSKRHAGSCLS